MSVLPTAVKSVAEARVAVKRISNFLQLPDVHDSRALHPDKHNAPYPVILKRASFSYGAPASEASVFSLQRLNLKIQKGECIAVVGKVGSGKSSFLLSLAGELPLSSGSAILSGTVAYVSQQSWLLNDTLKASTYQFLLASHFCCSFRPLDVVFGQPFDSKRYVRSLECCQLAPDLEQLPARDATEIGERGINLSGGQKARVSLARAVFANRDIYLLDDPLSAVDQHVGNRLFKRCLRGALSGKTIVFVTNQLQYLSKCDRVIVLEAGKVAEVGQFDELVSKGGALADLVRNHISTKNPSDEDDSEISERSARAAKVKLSDSGVTNKLVVAEDKTSGKYVSHAEHCSATNSIAVLAARCTVSTSVPAAGPFSVCSVVPVLFSSDLDDLLLAWVICLNLLQQGIRATSDWWVSFWSKAAPGAAPFTFYIWVYAVLLVGYGVALLVRCFSFAVFNVRASTSLHNGVFHRVLRAPMLFFDSTPLGRILNRFTKDQDNVDDALPDAFEQAVQSLLTVLSGVIVIISVLWWFAIALLPIGAAFWFLGVYYRRTSREIKRLDGVTRSPVFAHLSATLNGLATLRAYGVTDSFEKQNRDKLDVNTSMQYHFEVAARWLAVRLDFLSLVIVSGTAFLTVAMRDVVPASLSALALSYALQTTGMMQWGVRMLAETENQMTSVERLMYYTDNLDQEAPGVVANHVPPASWPHHPRIEYRKVELRYSPSLEPALKRVSFTIEPREKVGVVGRTGAGKSTLAISLFRIIEPSRGKILIDGINVLEMGLDHLRSKLAIIPQDPVLFKHTVRYNLDPFGLHDDAQLWRTLEKVFLKDVIQAMNNGLDSQVLENGSNFSAGQRQLVCFGRALLRDSKILVLDEATASIDLATDDRIQKTIRQTFADCTVITIAHRLHTIIDSDRIMLLDRGTYGLASADRPSNPYRRLHRRV